jgi:hypothetical protein
MSISTSDDDVRDNHKQGVISEHPDEMVIAKSIAQAVECLPWITDMSTGSFQEKITYGRGGHVSGVILRDTKSGTSAVEVGVIVAEKALIVARSLPAQQHSGQDTVPLLLRLADQLRTVIYRTALDLGLSTLTKIDISIDDIR